MYVLWVGVVGFSVGYVIVYIFVVEGVCGILWLVDFDKIELLNLNCVLVGVFDIGFNKVMIVVCRIVELDFYLVVDFVIFGFLLEFVDEFFDGFDVVIEECDLLDIKVIL